jgi:transmembrane protein EpsG
LFILALLQGISLVVFFRKYSMNYILSIFLFVASTDYLSWMFNGIRQFMAVTIILFATPFMLKKKYIPAIFIILLASTMHQSALLMIPFMFIAQGEVWNQKTILFIGLSLLAIVFVGQFTNLLDDALANTQYATVVSDYTSWNDDGTNPLRVLVYSVPALLAFTGRERIRSEGSALINLCANMSIISMGLYLVSMVTSGIFIGRLPIYCSLYGYILLPWEIENCFTEESHRLAMSMVIVFYMLFYGFQLRSWGMV